MDPVGEILGHGGGVGDVGGDGLEGVAELEVEVLDERTYGEVAYALLLVVVGGGIEVAAEVHAFDSGVVVVEHQRVFVHELQVLVAVLIDNLLELATGEGVGAKHDERGWQADARELSACESLIEEILQRGRQRNLGDGAALEGAVVDGLETVAEVDLRELFVVGKGVFAHEDDVVGQVELGEAALAEGFVVDASAAFGEVEGGERRAVEAQRVGDELEAVGQAHALQRRAFVEHLLVDLLDAV